MKQQGKDQSSRDRLNEKSEKNFFEILQEMPFSNDRVGQSFIRRLKSR